MLPTNWAKPQVITQDASQVSIFDYLPQSPSLVVCTTARKDSDQLIFNCAAPDGRSRTISYGDALVQTVPGNSGPTLAKHRSSSGQVAVMQHSLSGGTCRSKAMTGVSSVGTSGAVCFSAPQKQAEMIATAKAVLFPIPQGKIVEKTHEMTVWKSSALGSDGWSMPLICISFQIPHISAHDIYNFIRDKGSAPKWHHSVASVEDLTEQLPLGKGVNNGDDVATGLPGSGGTSLKVWRTKYKIPGFVKFLGFPPREVLEFRVCTSADPDAYFIIGSSTGTETLDVPYSPGVVRAHLTLGLYAIIPHIDGGCELRSATHVNPIGIPEWILNVIATTKPKEFIHSVLEQMALKEKKENAHHIS